MTKDPYRYFRIEARELVEGLGTCLLELEKAPSDKAVIGRLLRLAHTLKGASRVVKLGSIAEQVHSLEDALALYRDGGSPVPQAQINSLLRLLDGVGASVTALDPAVDTAGSARAAPEEPSETVRVEVEEVDTLLEGVTETTVIVNALRRESAALEHAQRVAKVIMDQLGPRRVGDAGATGAVSLAKIHALAEELGGSLERVQRNISSSVQQITSELVQVRDAAHRLRLLPASTVFPSLERAARDAAQSLKKKIAFEASGGELRLDAHVLAALRDALLHVVRNAVAHGIESESDRLAAHKPAVGRIALVVERRGNRIAFLCQDDGRGVDVDAVRRAAVGRGLVSATAAELAPEDAFRLLLQGGLTTTLAVTEVSGRGVGLDVLRETAARLKGELSLRSNAGRGATVEICVPVSLSSSPALVVDAGGTTASVPLDAVRRTLRLADSDIARSSESDSIVYEGTVIPFVPLAVALRQQTGATRAKRPWTAVVVQSGTALAAVGVDRLLGTTNVVVRPIPMDGEVDPVVAGAALDAEGHPQLVLDPDALVAAAQAGRGAPISLDASPSRPVLVVDDSLTTRMLEQSILESAGYEVEVATSAEEALSKAKDKRYGLFIVDVEMPGMDGFGFVARTQSDPTLRETPAILVTSRGSTEDRQRGVDVGARGYIVKGEFDQDYLLQTIRKLVGVGAW